MNPDDARLAAEFAVRCEEARTALRLRMAEHGLSEKDGWRIHEVVRQADGRTEMVMRPTHRHLTAPPDLVCLCSIDEPGTNISADCP